MRESIESLIRAYILTRGTNPTTIYMGHDEYLRFRASRYCMYKAPFGRESFLGLTVIRVCEDSYLEVA